jgi:hypothetical protein
MTTIFRAISCTELRCEKFGVGVTAITPPVLATGTGKTVDNVITELQALGLVTQS